MLIQSALNAKFCGNVIISGNLSYSNAMITDSVQIKVCEED
jgi:hypothetical protein